MNTYKIPPFTTREMDVLKVMHKDTDEICKELDMNQRSLEKHIENIEYKLKARTRTEALLVAIAMQVVPFPLKYDNAKLNVPALSDRHKDILSRLHLKNQLIAEKLHLSVRTVEFHIENILSALGVEHRLDAMLTALELGVVPMPDLSERLKEERNDGYKTLSAEQMLRAGSAILDQDSLADKCEKLEFSVTEKFVLSLLFASTEDQNVFRMRKVSEIALAQSRPAADVLADLDSAYSRIHESGWKLAQFVFGAQTPFVTAIGGDDALAEIRELRATIAAQETQKMQNAEGALRWSTGRNSQQSVESKSPEPQVIPQPVSWSPPPLSSFQKPVRLYEGTETVKKYSNAKSAKSKPNKPEGSNMAKQSKSTAKPANKATKPDSSTRLGNSANHTKCVEENQTYPAGLSQRQHEVVTSMFAADGSELKNKDIAKLMNISEGNVSYLKSTAKTKLINNNMSLKSYAKRFPAAATAAQPSAVEQKPEISAERKPAVSAECTAEEIPATEPQSGTNSEGEKEAVVENESDTETVPTTAQEASDNESADAEPLSPVASALQSPTISEPTTEPPQKEPEVESEAASEQMQSEPDVGEIGTLDLSDLFGDEMSSEDLEKGMAAFAALLGGKGKGREPIGVAEMVSVAEELLEANEKQLQAQAAFTNAFSVFLNAIKKRLS